MILFDTAPQKHLHQAAAVDHQCGASDVASRVARQEQGRADQFLGLRPAAQDGFLGEDRLLVCCQQAGRKIGQERPGRQAVDRDAEGSPDRSRRRGSGRSIRSSSRNRHFFPRRRSGPKLRRR